MYSARLRTDVACKTIRIAAQDFADDRNGLPIIIGRHSCACMQRIMVYARKAAGPQGIKWNGTCSAAIWVHCDC